MRVVRVLSAVLLSGIVAGCQRPSPPTEPAPAAKPYANLAQLMRAIPFPNSNIVFDTQSNDPAAQKPATDASAGAPGDYTNVYAGWQSVENAALAISESAALIMIPGRLCENGLPAPVDREDYKKFAAGLAEAGLAAYKAAQSKNLDAMVDVSGTVSDACAACHDVYRDKPEGEQRCLPN